MKVSFVLFMLCLTASSSALTKKNPTARIFGGQRASEGQFPWYAWVLTHYLGETGSSVGTCGGALISPKWILTAAHCVVEDGKKVLKIEVQLGLIYRQMYKTRLLAKNYIPHPDYDFETPGVNDIGLIELRESVKFSDRIASIRIISKQVPNDKNLTVIGFGKTEFGFSSDYLLYVDVMKVDSNECVKKFPLVLPERIVCCKGERAKDICKGDTGGPLILYEKDEAFLVGVVSGGPQCGFGLPRIFTSALAYSSWIKQISQI